MRVLVIGDGARDHALCWKLVESPLVDELHCAPGNVGVATLAECVPISIKAINTLLSFCEDNEVEFIVVGGEQALAAGLIDICNRNGLPAFGPEVHAARLGLSKAFARALCERNQIPMAPGRIFTDAEAAKSYVAEAAYPLVIKGDVRIDGAKVAICQNRAEAEAAIAARFKGDPSEDITIEAFVEGEPVSFCGIADANIILPLTSTTDRWDVGGPQAFPGALCPAPAVTPEIQTAIIDTIMRPAVVAMKAERRAFKGLLNASLMLTADGPKLLDFKATYHDPDWQAIMLRIKGDLMPALASSFDEMLERFNDFRWVPESAIAITMRVDEAASAEKIAAACEEAEVADPDVVVFRAYDEKQLNITASGTDLADVRKRLYAAAARIKAAL
ncbi:phosphoribosylamine--glycine ligase [Methylovirgula sp. HY1]|uniref:phosphoribosylamine--glycine ligase n=1 Tax=Methylovirgula sp. HY1 TaxID=2822761 RepID=UPI001C5AAB9E|nr:phosphoribosylamine--glycine ligase [Methylovirgula sp. HY1]QXX74341.1 Phosphoribosylamine--glycine ligase [Methylovirgula sp. HY1]